MRCKIFVCDILDEPDGWDIERVINKFLADNGVTVIHSITQSSPIWKSELPHESDNLPDGSLLYSHNTIITIFYE